MHLTGQKILEAEIGEIREAWHGPHKTARQGEPSPELEATGQAGLFNKAASMLAKGEVSIRRRKKEG